MNETMTRRDFIRRIALIAVLATPIGKYLYGKWEASRIPQIPTIDLVMSSTPVRATTRKLKCQWTVEAAQDLECYHSVGVERELSRMIKRETIADRAATHQPSSYGAWERNNRFLLGTYRTDGMK